MRAYTGLAASVLWAMAGMAFAGEAVAQDALKRLDGDLLTNDTLSVSAYGGLLTGMAQEFVFDTSGNTISRLDWRSSIPVVGGEANVHVSRTVTLHVGGYTSLGAGSGAMDDYDWLYTSSVKASDANWTNGRKSAFPSDGII